MPDKVLIFDTTLRDGEQSPGISLNKSEKLTIAYALAELGVDVIEAGFPISSNGDFEAVQAIARKVEGPTICGLARAIEKDIDRCWEAIKDAKSQRIHTFMSTSDVHLKYQMKKTQLEVIEMTKARVSQAKNYCDDIEFSPMDASRSDFDFLIEVLQTAVDNGATTINIADTVGFAVPHEFGAWLNKIRESVHGNYILSTHCHNDLGMATANSLAGVGAGARQVEVAVNGIGERAGNAALEEIVMALKVKSSSYGDVYTDVDSKLITKTSRLVSNLTGYPVQYNKAIVGRNAFAHESGIHQDGVIKKRETYEIIDPADVGAGGSQIILGKHSGRAAIASALKKLGHELSPEQINEIFVAFKALADQKNNVSDADLNAIVDSTFSRSQTDSQSYELSTVSFTLSENEKPSATIAVKTPGGELVETSATGNGMVDAVCTAIREIVGLKIDLVEYLVQAVTESIDALATVNIQLRSHDKIATGRGSDTDVVRASAKAYLDAVNRLLAIEDDSSTTKAQAQ